MPTVSGSSDVKRYIERAAAELEKKVLRGAARAAAEVIAAEIKARTPSDNVRDGVRVRTDIKPGRVVGKVDLKPGWARSLGTWLEYGTDPHFITVGDSQREGMTAGRINRLTKQGSFKPHSLMIGGKFVGGTVFHLGARPHPTFRPALDAKKGEAIAAAQAYINSRVGRLGIGGNNGPMLEDDD